MSVSLGEACQSSNFGSLSIFSTEILSVKATPVTNYTVSAPSTLRLTQPSIEKDNVSLCNITVTYTHPSQDDLITVETWLPKVWNERLQAVGGGGWVAGRFIVSYKNMEGAVADGYATVTTDAGIGAGADLDWGLLSVGNVDLYNIQNFASVSLIDEVSSFGASRIRKLISQARIAKSLIKRFYGKEASYSYWNGCSQGGRQGLMLAQRYPEAYDGIAAGAPAINFPQLQPSIYWTQHFMQMYVSVPYPCEVDYLREAVLEACDGLDGLVDGILGEPQACLAKFDPFQSVGKKVHCNGNGTQEISQAAAAIVDASWRGMTSEDGRKTGFGFSPAADLTGNDPLFAGTPGPLGINCTSGECIGQPNPQLLQWFSIFIAADASLDVSSLSHADFDRLVHLGVQRYQSFLGTADTDLSAFRDRGGKMVTYHGLVRQPLSCAEVLTANGAPVV